MAASTIALTYTELRRWIGREIGASRSSADWSAITTSDAGDILKIGLHDYYWPKLPGGGTHVWSWLKPKLANLELHGPYTTGTVSVTTGTVTGSGTTFPSWAAQGDIYIQGGYWSTVATRGGDTTLTLDDTSITGLSGKTYTLVHREYTLEDDFGGLTEPFTYRPDQSQWTTIETVNEAMIRSNDAYPTVRGLPRRAAITAGVPSASVNSKSTAIFDPPPDQTYQLWYRYLVIPPMLDGSSFVYAHGGPQYMAALVACCLDVALRTLYNDWSKHAAAQEALAAAIELDKKTNRPDTLGFGSHSHGYDRGDSYSLRDHRRNASVGTLNLT